MIWTNRMIPTERATGIEPAQSVWKTETLPLSYARNCAGTTGADTDDTGW
jgi:hypothetical protein